MATRGLIPPVRPLAHPPGHDPIAYPLQNGSNGPFPPGRSPVMLRPVIPNLSIHPKTLIALICGLALPSVALGDSVTAWGDSMTPGTTTGWPAQFAALSGTTMNARGVGGETSTQIKTRFMAESARWGDFTIIWAGRNNYGYPATVRKAFRSYWVFFGNKGRRPKVGGPDS